MSQRQFRQAMREKRKNAVSLREDVRRNGMKVHDRRWVFVVVIILLVVLVWYHVI